MNMKVTTANSGNSTIVAATPRSSRTSRRSIGETVPQLWGGRRRHLHVLGAALQLLPQDDRHGQRADQRGGGDDDRLGGHASFVGPGPVDDVAEQHLEVGAQHLVLAHWYLHEAGGMLF